MSMTAKRLAGLSPEKRKLLAQRVAQNAAAPTSTTAGRIAIVSAACRLPGGVNSPDVFWRLLAEGRDAVTDVPASRWDGDALYSDDSLAPNHIHSRCGGFLDGVDMFDAAFFGISPREAAAIDPQQRLLLELAWEALESGGHAVERLAGSACGVFIGAHSHSSDYWLMQLAQRGGVETHTATGSAHSVLANRISYALDLRGPSLTVDTACSSSLVAIHLACQSLRTGECDLALAGGVNLMLGPSASLAFSKLQILSPGGRCRSFDAAADGIVRGEGAALVVLKRLPDTIRDGDPILALVAGSAVNQDGASNGLTAPSGQAQEEVVSRALAMAGLGAERYGLIETHGTGTPLGDPVEVEALSRVIGTPRAPEHRCWLGAVKTNIGHLEGAAGIAGLVKAVLCLREGKVPPNLHFTTPNPHLRLAGTVFKIPTALEAWPSAALPRVAGVSSFGFGGTNAHVVLEEHRLGQRDDTASPPAAREQWITISARDRGALREQLSATAADLRKMTGASDAGGLADFAYTARVRRSHHPFRVAAHAASAAALADRLEARLADRLAVQPVTPKSGVVWVFSGQGGLWPAAARELFETEPVFRAALDEVITAFGQRSGWDLRPPLLDDGFDVAKLAATDVAQPALFALQVALAAQWRALGLMPGAIIGHSAGEIAASHAAGVLSLADAVRVVHERSRVMQPAMDRGRMAQVACTEEELQSELVGGEVCLAATNGPRMCVLSGTQQALEASLARLDARGIKARRLDMRYAFHSKQMQPFAPLVQAALSGLGPHPATVPLMSTVTGRWADPTAGDYGAAYWARNVRETVRFAPAVAELVESGYRCFLEVGPHPALGAGIVGTGEEHGASVTVVGSLRARQPALPALIAGLCELYEAGAEIAWTAQRDSRRRVVALPPYPWQRQRHWLDMPDPAALAFNVLGRMPQTATATAIGSYAMSWPFAAQRSGSGAAVDIDLAALSANVMAEAAKSPLAQSLASDDADFHTLEERSARWAWDTIVALGLAERAGALIPIDTTSAGILPQHARLWRRLLQLASARGYLERAPGDFFRVGADIARPQIRPVKSRPEAVLLDRCGRSLPDVLRGRVDPLALLFPEVAGDDESRAVSAADVYARTDAARFYNGMAASVVAEFARGAKRPLRVIEIGGGTGATTSALLSTLPAGGDYTFTDVSPLFVKKAEQRFGAAQQAQRLAFRRLDIECPPAEQGFAADRFDVVVAVNVLHATKDLQRSLSHARTLLADDGLLLLVETTAPRAWADLTFGLVEGWWRFADAPLRTEHALLDADTWCRTLDTAGFTSAQALGAELSSGAVLPQAVIVARASNRSTSRPRRFVDTSWHVVVDRSGFGEKLAEALRVEGATCTTSASDAAPSLALSGAVKVVHCGALDAPMAAGMMADGLPAVLSCSVGSALTWAQLLIHRPDEGASSSRLWIVTRGGAVVHPHQEDIAAAAAPTWGLGRTLALEHPRQWGGLIDLDPKADDEPNLAGLLNVLAADDAEDQVALRADAVRVARLTPMPIPPRNDRPFRASAGAVLITGGYGGLGPKVARWLADCGAQHIILVGRSGAPIGDAAAAFEADLNPLHSRKVELIFERADVADPDAMQQLFERQAAAGRPVRGIVHLAASIRFQALASLNAADLDEALRAKVGGALVLHELTRGLPPDQALDFFILFSSATTLFGAKGLAAYAAANSFLAALADHRVALGLPATCVDWGAWSKIRLLGGAQHSDISQLGHKPMADDEAFAMLAGLVQGRVSTAMIAEVDWPTACAAYQAFGRRPFLAEMERRVGTGSPHAPGTTQGAVDLLEETPPDLRTTLAPLVPRARIEQMVRLVRTEVARVLGLPDPQAVDPGKGFFELGLDSLMAMQLRRSLVEKTGVALPATVTFNHPSTLPLAQHLLERLGLPAAQDSAATTEPLAGDDVSTLSDDEVHNALLSELAAAGLPDEERWIPGDRK